jgi:hypothetical protein
MILSSYDFDEELQKLLLEHHWRQAAREAEIQKREFICYDHPLLPGWRLHVNARQGELPEPKPDPAPPELPALRYYANRRWNRRLA